MQRCSLRADSRLQPQFHKPLSPASLRHSADTLGAIHNGEIFTSASPKATTSSSEIPRALQARATPSPLFVCGFNTLLGIRPRSYIRGGVLEILWIASCNVRSVAKQCTQFLLKAHDIVLSIDEKHLRGRLSLELVQRVDVVDLLAQDFRATNKYYSDRSSTVP